MLAEWTIFVGAEAVVRNEGPVLIHTQSPLRESDERLLMAPRISGLLLSRTQRQILRNLTARHLSKLSHGLYLYTRVFLHRGVLRP